MRVPDTKGSICAVPEPGSGQAWERVLAARHPKRPHASDFIAALVGDFVELHGDRMYRDDPAVVGGIGRFGCMPVMLIGQEKGREVEERIRRNFGMAFPEGYRKACRLMRLADRLHIPILTLVDTPGAYPGLGAEQRGQVEAIATSLEAMASLRVPVVAAIIGEGGSGGALALGLADRVLMLENAVYSVISPEGCASILWHDASKAPTAAMALKLSAAELLPTGLIDEVVREPGGGAHLSPEETFASLVQALKRSFCQLLPWDPEAGREKRLARYLALGGYHDPDLELAAAGGDLQEQVA